jgi:hypothetical protein
MTGPQADVLLACQHLDRVCCSHQGGRVLQTTCFVTGKAVALHRSGADMPFLSAVASAVASAEPACAMLLTADDGAERLVMHIGNQHVT